MYYATRAGYVVIIHWCRRRLPVLINAHVYICVRKLGDIEEEACPISSRMPGRPLSISRGIGRAIVLMKSFSVKKIPCGCGGLHTFLGVKWEFDGSPFEQVHK